MYKHILRYFNKQLKATIMFNIHFMIYVDDDCFDNVVTSNSGGGAITAT